jgi:hypothetical protein
VGSSGLASLPMDGSTEHCCWIRETLPSWARVSADGSVALTCYRDGKAQAFRRYWTSTWEPSRDQMSNASRVCGGSNEWSSPAKLPENFDPGGHSYGASRWHDRIEPYLAMYTGPLRYQATGWL